MVRSFIFRLIIISFATWIVTHNNNCFNSYAFLFIIPLYFVLYFVLKIKQKEILRLLLDFLFINIVVFGKQINDPMVFMLVVIPMINAVNYSGRETHMSLLSLLTVVTLLINIKSLESWIIIPIISLVILYLLAKRRYKEWNIAKSLTNSVDSYFTDPAMLKPHQIYANIIADLNQYFKFNLGEGIKQIRTYTLKGDLLWLVNASDFLWERTLELGPTNVDILRKTKELKLNSDQTDTFFFYIKIEGIEYVFACLTSHSSDLRLKLYNFKDIMMLTFNKMSTLLSTEYRISERREKKFNEIKDNVLYVNQAVKAMHFIRNKLTPLSNLVAYHKELDSMSEEVRNKIKDTVNREVKQASKDLSEILNFANYLLDKSKNPFHGTEVSEISLLKIYIILSEIAERHMNKTIHVDDSLKNKVSSDQFISTNLVECKIMFTDWINNMSKYSSGDELIKMSVENDTLVVHFENKCTLDDGNIDHLVHDMNSKGKDAVLEGKDYGYGIYIIKSIANDFGVEINAAKQKREKDTYLLLDFKFAIYGRKEDTNI